jgi:hypothetical protein
MTLPPSDRLVRNWRYRSAEMRAISEMMKHDETRATMERLADSYDEMADNMERRLVQGGQHRTTSADDGAI